jgi:hypothetical protein
MKYFLSILIFCVLSFPVVAQDQCTINLNQAEDKFDRGQLYEIPDIINACLANGFTKEQKIRAYRLLTLTYLYLNYYDEADKTYLELLTLSPEYKINEELDPVEIINHHEKFTTSPIFYLTLGKVGVNVSHANVMTDYSLSTSNDGSTKYASVLGFHAGFGAEMVIYQNLHLYGEFMVTNKKIHLTDTHWGFYNTNMDLVRTEVEIPILLKYNFFRGKINPFISAGISPSYMMNSSIQNIEGSYLVINESNGGEVEEFPVQPRPEISTSELNARFNFTTILGAGINYKIGLNYIVFEARYSLGMLNTVKPDDRWRLDNSDIRDLKFPTGHVYDDYKLNNLSFFIGFVKPLYKPRKIK